MDERAWTNTSITAGESISASDLSITRLPSVTGRLISGDIGAALQALSPDATMVGLADDIGLEDAAIRIAQDRMLLLSPLPQSWIDGWYDQGFAVSHADELYATLKLSGSSAETAMAQISSYRLGQQSPSAAILCAGHTVLLARQGSSYLLFVEPPDLPEIISLLKGVNAV